MPWRWKSKEGKNNTRISHCERFNKFIKSILKKKILSLDQRNILDERTRV